MCVYAYIDVRKCTVRDAVVKGGSAYVSEYTGTGVCQMSPRAIRHTYMRETVPAKAIGRGLSCASATPWLLMRRARPAGPVPSPLGIEKMKSGSEYQKCKAHRTRTVARVVHKALKRDCASHGQIEVDSCE